MVEICVWEQSETSLKGNVSTNSASTFRRLLKMPKNIENDEGLNLLFIRGKRSIELFTTGCNQLSHYSFIHSFIHMKSLHNTEWDMEQEVSTSNS